MKTIRCIGTMTAALALWMAGESRAADLVLSRIAMSNGNVTITWNSPTNRFIVEGLATLVSAPEFVSSSTGQVSSSISFPVTGATVTFFRVRQGLEAVVFTDPVLRSAVSSGIANKIQPANAIYDIEVGGITNLNLSRNGVMSLDGAQSLRGLTRADLSGNDISSAGPLIGATNLVRVYLDGNAITGTAAFASLTSLEELDLAGNEITALDGLAGLQGLARLYLDGNQVSSVLPLAGLLGLTTLDLSNNAVTDIAGLLANAAAGGLGKGDTVYLVGNPIADPSQIAALRGYGVNVVYP